jgi:hypothetical protein
MQKMKQHLKHLLCFFFIGMSMVADLTAQVLPVVQLKNNGPNDKRINIVYLGDGYTSAEQAKFITDATLTMQNLFLDAPFKEYEQFFNVFAVQASSLQSGAKHPGTATDVVEPAFPISNPSTRFESSFDIGGIHRLVAVNNVTELYSVLSANTPSYDLVFLLANTPEYGGSGGAVAVATLATGASDLLTHEVGHTFGGLSDEYPVGFCVNNQNQSLTNDPNTVSWKNWLGTNGVGIYEIDATGCYRPHQNCKMQFLGSPFCAVCKEGIINKIYAQISSIEGYLPLNNIVSVTSGATNFSVDLILPTPNTLAVQWYVNGVLVPNNSTTQVTLQAASFNPGANTVKARVSDATLLSRVYWPAMSGYADSVIWTVNRVATCNPDITPPQLTACPAPVAVTTTGTNATATWVAPTATDACPGSVTVTSTHQPGQTFAVGVTTVTYTARDAAQNSATCSFTVTVTSQPSGCANNLLTNAGFESGLTGWNAGTGITAGTPARTGAAAMSNCQNGGQRIFQFMAANAGKTYTFKGFGRTTGTGQGVLFVKFLNSGFTPLSQDFANVNASTYTEVTLTKLAPVGTSWIEVGILRNDGTGCLLFDDACLTESGVSNPCAPDVTPPVLAACPANITVTVSTTTANVNWTPPTATDACPGAVTVIGTRQPGSSFPTGNTTVIYTARDAAQNSATCSFSVTVIGTINPCNPDLTPPVLSSCPGNLTGTTATNQARLDWVAPTATDNCVGVVTVTGSQASGSLFPIGNTVVQYTARDVAQNAATCTFTVSVQAVSGGCTGNLLTNAGFESGLTDWNAPAGVTAGTPARTGATAMSICQNGGLRIFQFKAAASAKTYAFKGFGQVTGTAQGVLFMKFMTSGFSPILQEFANVNATAYTEYTITKAAPAGTAWIEVGILRNDGSGCLLFDDACLVEASSGNPCAPDVTPPVLTACPANIAVVATTGSTAPATWTAPTATDACGPATITITNSPGAQFGVGVTTVVYSALDAAQNLTTCFFTVTVSQSGGGTPNCAAASDFPWEEWISAVKVGNTTNTSGKAPFTFYFTQPFSGVRGSSVPIELTASYSYFTDSEYFRVWIDYNDDKIYQASELVYSGIVAKPADGTPSKSISGSFVVPSNAPIGFKKMRVIMQRQSYAEACGTVPYGEVEDYYFDVVGALQSSSNGQQNNAQEEVTDIRVYPNPASQTVTLDLSVLKGLETQVRILDAFGVEVLNQKTEQPSLQLDLTDWNSGLYLLRFEPQGQRPTVQKLVVVKE